VARSFAPAGRRSDQFPYSAVEGTPDIVVVLTSPTVWANNRSVVVLGSAEHIDVFVEHDGTQPSAWLPRCCTRTFNPVDPIGDLGLWSLDNGALTGRYLTDAHTSRGFR